jgi:aminoglycoside phosphotransferase (APT) family kinase protein
MTASPERENLEVLIQRIAPQSTLLGTWELRGGVSAQLMAFVIALPTGEMKKMIVRQPGEAARQLNPRVAADEFKLLQILTSAGLPVPAPYLLDESCALLPAPYLVMDYVEGKVEVAPANLGDFLHRFAAQLAKIHRLDASAPDLAFLPKQADWVARTLREPPARAAGSSEQTRIRETLSALPHLPQNEPVLLHGDFWPGNILWREGQLVAVVDWENAALGDPLADLAKSRLDLLWIFGLDAMNEFTRAYESMTGFDLTNLPYWDLYAARRPAFQLAEWAAVYPAFGRPDITEQTMREGLAWFTAQAFGKLPPCAKE